MNGETPEQVIRGDFRQGLITSKVAVAYLRFLGRTDAQAIVDKWADELAWEDCAYEHRKAFHE